MTVSSAQSYIEYNGDGVTKTFPIPFYFILSTDISITITDADGTVTTLINGTDYTVIGEVSQSGGAAILNVAPASGVLVTIYRDPPVTQETAYYENGKFPAKSHEKALDKLTMIIQSILLKFNNFNSRSVRVPEAGNWVAPKIADRKNKVFTWDDSGNPTATLPPSGSATDVLIELAKPTGAGITGATDEDGNPTTVQDELDALHGQTSHIGGDISLTDSVVTAGTYSEMEFVGDLPHYTAGFTIPKNPALPYDHFGLIMKTRDGRIFTFFRRASIHTGSADAAIMKSELLSTGWSVPIQVISSPGLDVRCASGGVMPNGNIVLCINLMQSDNTPRDVVFYRSRDCGETWELIQTIPVSQSAGYAYTIPYGQFAVMGNKVVIPFYKRVDTVFSVSFFQTTDNGDTWTVGPNIYSGANDYNETQIACIGRYAIAISRVASGIGAKFHIFTSTDGGAAWVDQGDSNLTGGDTGYVVAPTLYVRRTKSGTPYILFLYVDRTAQVLFYRYSSLTRIIAGDYTFSEKYRVTGNMTNSSGYQSGFFEGNRLIGIVWKETSPQAAAQGDSFEIFTPDIPDYDSGWVSVAALQNYTLTTGYNQKMKDIDLFFSPDANAGTIHKVSTGQVSTSGAGAGVALTDTQVVLRTGTYPYSNSLFGSSGGTNYTTGFYRVYGWL